MEADVLVAGEQVQQGTRDTGQALEVAQAGRVHVDPAEADPFSLDVADPRARPVETGGAPPRPQQKWKWYRVRLIMRRVPYG